MPEPEAVEETVEAAPSADNGNVPVDAPSEPADKTTAPPADNVEPAAPTEPVVELFELPDGRKVDAETLSREWKDNFMPDYTKKSQALAEKEKGNLPTNEPAKKPYENPDWAPKTYAELIDIAKAEIKEDQQNEAKQAAEQRAAVENQVIGQITDIKGGYVDANGVKVPADPTLNENALFTHAIKYGFQDLKAAHQNMKDMAAAVKTTVQTTVKNMQKRSDPVSITPGASGGQGQPRTNFGNAVEFLRSIKK